MVSTRRNLTQSTILGQFHLVYILLITYFAFVNVLHDHKHHLHLKQVLLYLCICPQIPLISQQSIQVTTEGNIISLISNDVQRMELAPRVIFSSSLSGFEFVAAICLLLYLIGWQALIGVGFLMALIPCVIEISSVCARLRQETAEVADRRISLMNELVTGIRALKTHAWEENYREKIEEVRR